MVAKNNSTGFLAFVWMIVLVGSTNFEASLKWDKLPDRYSLKAGKEKKFYENDPYNGNSTSSRRESGLGSLNDGNSSGCAYKADDCSGGYTAPTNAWGKICDAPRIVAHDGGNTPFARGLAHGMAADGDFCTIS